MSKASRGGKELEVNEQTTNANSMTRNYEQRSSTAERCYASTWAHRARAWVQSHHGDARSTDSRFWPDVNGVSSSRSCSCCVLSK